MFNWLPQRMGRLLPKILAIRLHYLQHRAGRASEGSGANASKTTARLTRIFA
jgi:hypothetical protein